MAKMIYDIKSKIEGLLNDNPLVNNVHRGAFDDFLQQKKNFYPAARVDFGDTDITNEVLNMSVAVTIVGQVDEGFDNENDVINTNVTIAARLIAQLQEAEHDAAFEVIDSAAAEYIFEQGESNYAGFGPTIQLITPNTAHNG